MTITTKEEGLEFSANQVIGPNPLELATNLLAGVRGSRTHLPRSSRGTTDLKSARATGPLPLPRNEIEYLAGDHRIYLFLQYTLRHRAYDLIYGLAVFEEDQRGNAAHAVFHGDIGR